VQVLGISAFASITLCETGIIEITFPETCYISIFNRDLFCGSPLVSINIPSSIEEIHEYAFSDCGSLREVLFREDSKLRIIKEFVFAYSGLRVFQVPPTVRVIQNRCFSVCLELRSIIIPRDTEMEQVETNIFFGVLAYSKKRLEFPSCTVWVPTGVEIVESSSDGSFSAPIPNLNVTFSRF
jgi:hypothetical protein